jgi:hypothetical protein
VRTAGEGRREKGERRREKGERVKGKRLRKWPTSLEKTYQEAAALQGMLTEVVRGFGWYELQVREKVNQICGFNR